MDPCDWMTLSAMQDTSNLWLDFEGRPAGLSQGTYARGDKWMLENVDNCVAVKEITCHFWGEDDATEQVNSLVTKYGDRVIVLVGNDSGMLEEGGQGEPDGKENHIVRLLAPVSLSDLVQCSIFTWAKQMDLQWDIKRYRKWVYRFIIGALDKDVDLG